MGNRVVVLVAALGALEGSGCRNSPGADATTHTVSGTVRGGVPTGVRISVSGAATVSATTDLAGRYTVNLPNGDYTLTPCKVDSRFSPSSIAITVSGSDTPGQDFLLCSADGWCWLHPIPQGDYLSGVWGSGPSDVWLVGNGGTILHWDGAVWAGSPSPTTDQLYALWGSGPSDVWAVGDNGAIVHWDGMAWTGVPSGTSSTLQGVWGSGPSDVWAVGGGGTILYWDGVSWTNGLGGTLEDLFGLWGDGLYDVWGSGPNDVWVVGALPMEDFHQGAVPTAVLHWDGATWSSLSIGTTDSFQGIWGSGPSDVWAVGVGGAMAHWNGNSW